MIRLPYRSLRPSGEDRLALDTVGRVIPVALGIGTTRDGHHGAVHAIRNEAMGIAAYGAKARDGSRSPFAGRGLLALQHPQTFGFSFNGELMVNRAPRQN